MNVDTYYLLIYIADCEKRQNLRKPILTIGENILQINYGLKCKTCSGKGYVYVMVKGYYGKYRTSKTCKPCSGNGNLHYSVKYRRYRYGTCSNCRYHSPKGSDTCTDCDGDGGKKPCPKCTGDKTLTCTQCPSD